VARTQAALAADPRNVQRRIHVAVAQSGVRQFREAIATLSDGLSMTPDDVMLLRWRGHRYISVREFALARADLTRGYALDSTNYGILFHLGVLHFAEGRFTDAVTMFMRAQPLAPDGGERAGSTDWLWMSLARAGRYAYVSRLRLYRGEVTPATLFTPADTADTQVATLNYGVGNWLLVRGDSAGARAAFERSVASGGWAGFGFIVSEMELQRMRAR
jgi:tetratricopeptide (TPR) repeat protein